MLLKVASACGVAFVAVLVALDVAERHVDHIPTTGPYRRDVIHAPVLSGLPLRVFAGAMRLPLIGTLLARKLRLDNGFGRVRAFAASLPHPAPLFFPYRPLTAAAAAATDPSAPVVGGGASSHIRALTAKYAAGSTSPVDVVRAVTAAIAESNAATPPLAAIVALNEQALEDAAASAARYASGAPLSPLDGVPVAVKVEVAVRGLPYSMGVGFLADRIAERDYPPVARLRAAGAIIIGGANMHEIGLGVTGNNAHYGAARNPYNASYHTGGSSSGSAAAVASGLVPVALACDGGGSIRIPASLCGRVGLKPTHFRVATETTLGGWTVGATGPIGATVEDVRLMLEVIAAAPLLPQPPLRFGPEHASRSLSGVRIGVFREYNADSSAFVRARTDAAMKELVSAGATIVDVVLPQIDIVFRAHVVSILSELAHHRDRYAPASSGNFASYGLQTQVQLLLAAALSAGDYVAAQVIRGWATREMDAVFAACDAVLLPATGAVAPRVPSHAGPNGELNLEVTDAIMRFSFLANFIGLPAIVVPFGVEAETNLPVGVQLLGPHWSEAELLRFAGAIEHPVDEDAEVVKRKSFHFNTYTPA